MFVFVSIVIANYCTGHCDGGGFVISYLIVVILIH